MKVKYKVQRAVTEEHLKLLRPYLLGEVARENGEWDMFCPLHEDVNRSAQLNVEDGVWYCHKCEVGGSVSSLVRKQSEWLAPTAAALNGSASTRRPAGQPKETITAAKVAGWSAALLANEPVLEDLLAARGLWTPTVKQYEIGWDGARNAYTIPVKDSSGDYVNIRRYQPRPPTGRRKMWGVSGMNAPRLYPVTALATEGPIIVCEGELDALVTNQYGFPAVTRTASAGTWKSSWNKPFKGRLVYLCHDMDHAGQEANRKVGLALSAYADEVRVIRLPYPLAEKGGKDLTDYWLDHDGDPDEFRRLLEEARPFDAESSEEEPEDIGPNAVSVLESFDARRVGKASRMTVTIKGKREPGYSVPRKIKYTCTQDAGEKCHNCPLFAAEGEDEKVVPGGDPVVLEMMEATKGQLTTAMRRHAKIPECSRLNIEVTEHQSVEILFARPSVDHTNASDAEAYKNLKLISVGRHDTMPNNTVQVVGALWPEPRSQLNSFLAWDIAQMETSLDRFELERSTIRNLQRFQPEDGERPLKKVRAIADDLAAHVTQIYGRPELHAAIDLVFHSVLSFEFAGKLMRRGWLDLLVVGDTRTGKSETAMRLAEHYRAGEVVSCEAASFAGVFGGLSQFGASKEWAVVWGAIPLNDRRLVVLDEAAGLDTEDIAKMSSVRSAGIAELTKIQQERTFARTRLVWLANPRNARMQDYTYGVQAIRPLIGNTEDIARFDLAMSVSAGEVASAEINRVPGEGRTRYPSDACTALIRWAWSRTPDQVVWAEGAERAVLEAAGKLGQRYIEDPPLIQVANVREKVARIAVAIAARTFSTDESFERLIVRRAHVRDAISFIDALYGMRGFGYAERSKELISDRKEAERKARDVKQFLYKKPWLAKFLRSTGKFRRQDLEEIGNIDREQANFVINTLWEARMVTKDRGDVRLTPTLHNILREVNIK